MKTFAIAVLCCLLGVTTALAQVYYWTDEKGVKHYSNIKPDEEVDFEEKKEEKGDTATVEQQPPSTQSAAPPNPPPAQTSPPPQQTATQPPAAAAKSPDQEPESEKPQTKENVKDVIAGYRLDIQKFPITQDQLIAEETARRQQLQAKFDQMGISRAERISAESERLMQAIRDLNFAPLPKFGSQDNKRRQVGYYKYQLQELTNSPDTYLKGPAE